LLAWVKVFRNKEGIKSINSDWEKFGLFIEGEKRRYRVCKKNFIIGAIRMVL
jgi:hypothetical protein